MRYEPIKDKLSMIVGENASKRRMLYSILGIIFLREWHVKRGLRRLFRQKGIKDVLDAGSGFGQYSYYIARKSRSRIVGVDINQVEVDKCNAFAKRMNLGNLSFGSADLEKLDFDDKFDLIVSVDVMEHIKDDIAVFKNFYRALRNGGKVLISTPSNFGGSDVHDEEEHSFIEEHFREGYSAEEITAKMKSANLRVERIQYTYGKIGGWYWNLAIKVPVKMLDKNFSLIVLLPFYYLISLPFALLFMLVDYLFPPKKGSGLLVIAEKL